MRSEDFEDFLNPDWAKDCHLLKERFNTAKPFKHLILEDFLRPDVLQRMLEEFPQPPELPAKQSESLVPKHMVRDISGLGGIYEKLDQALSSPGFTKYIESVTGIKDLIFDPEYFGGGTHNNQQGHALAPHVDFNYHPTTQLHRRLNIIIYLNEEWQTAWGGVLELRKDAWDPENQEIVSVLPVLGVCVIFETTETSWHGFDDIKLPDSHKDISRKSFAIYLYTQDRPADETQVEHSTVYIPKGLPEHIEPGYTLNEDDLSSIKKSLSRRDHHLKRLYAREIELAQTIARLKGELSRLKENFRLNVYGYAKQLSISPLPFSDGWISGNLDLEIEAFEDIYQIQIDTVIPDSARFHQEIYVQINDTSHNIVQKQRNQSTVINLSPKISKKARFTISMMGSVTSSGKDFGLNEDQRKISFKIEAIFFR